MRGHFATVVARAALVVGFWGASAACSPSSVPRATAAEQGAASPVVGSASSAAERRQAFENPGGMWMPEQMLAHADELRALGLELDPIALGDPMAPPLAAVVWLGGCTGSFVSSQGLVITNHHCATRALQYNSTPEDNLLEKGFNAAERVQERSIGPTGRVYVTQAMRDVTAEVRAGLEAMADAQQRHDAIEQRTKQLVARCEKDRPAIRCRVASYFGGGQYRLIEQLELRDIRLVYAPSEGIGNYGGEIDNWRWPRHSGDFALFRAYLGPDGMPADHAADNVPYRSPHYLRPARQPLGERDLVFVVGYPGRTSRLHTAREVREAVDWTYPRRLEMCDQYIALLEELSASDADLAIKARSLLRGLSNWRTNTQGMLDGLVQGGLKDRKLAEEAALERWMAESAERTASFGGVIARMTEAHAALRAKREHDAAIGEASWMSTLLGAANTIVRMAEERPKPDAQRDPDYQERNWKRLAQAQKARQRTYDRRLDRAKLELALVRAARLDPDRRPALLEWIVGPGEPTGERIRQAVRRMYARTSLESAEQRIALLEGASTAELRASADPFIALALKLRPVLQAIEDRDETYAGSTALDRPAYVAALRQRAGGILAPDANSSLRISFGTVRGYPPSPTEPPYAPFTRLPDVVGKHTGKRPFDAPAALLDAARHPAAAYMHPPLGEIPVNFLSDLDITGGNSGSPVLDARGELAGLAFDGNYEAMASDWLFMPAITRCISVDLRYVLWIMDQVEPAPHLLQEMGAKPAGSSLR